MRKHPLPGFVPAVLAASALLSCVAPGAVPPARPPAGGATLDDGRVATPAYRLLNVVAPIVAVTASVNPLTAPRVFDGDVATAWDSGTTTGPTLTLTLDGRYEVASLAVKVTPNVGTYDVLVSDDGASWRLALAAQANTTWNLENKPFDEVVVGRYVRLQFANGGKKVMAFEAKASATQPAPAPGTSPTPAPTPSASPSAPAPGPTPTLAAGAVIVVNPAKVRHAARSQLLGANRNHVAGAYPNGAAKLAKLRELQPTWGARKYLYRYGHGVTDGRYDYGYMTGFHFERTWDKTGPYPYDDLRFGLQDAATLGADQIHVVNFGTGDAAEAGRYVGYLNKADDPNRALHPVARQDVGLFEIGNEVSSSMVRGHGAYAPNETAYAQRARLFAQAMRANSDVPIRIGAVASTNSNWTGNGWSSGATAVRNILTTMGDQVDFLIFHGYPAWPVYRSADLRTIMAQNEWNRQKLLYEIKPAIQQYGGGRPIAIANTEFFTQLYGDVKRSRGMFGALFSADTVTLAMNEDLLASVQFCLDHNEMADASFFFNNDPAQVTAIFKFQRMLAQHWGDQVVDVAGSRIPTVQVAGAATTVALPRLAYTAATSGDRVYLMVTNRMDDADVTARVDVGFAPRAATAWELAGAWDAANGAEATIASPALGAYTFKRASITILEIVR